MSLINEPPRVPFGQMCEMPVGDGVIYRCSLRKGHEVTGEPHYAMEKPASVRAWQKWNAEQLAQQGVTVEPEYPGVYTEPPVEMRTIGGDITMHEIVVQTQPTKQREGDQRLPDGDTTQPDIQSLLMEDIRARREVGIERYGQAMQPFNGRNTIQDAYEEVIDQAVYLKALLVMREASHARLIEVAIKEVDDMIGGMFQGETRVQFCRDLATRIVMRLTDAAVIRAS